MLKNFNAIVEYSTLYELCLISLFWTFLPFIEFYLICNSHRSSVARVCSCLSHQHICCILYNLNQWRTSVALVNKMKSSKWRENNSKTTPTKSIWLGFLVFCPFFSISFHLGEKKKKKKLTLEVACPVVHNEWLNCRWMIFITQKVK